MKRCNLIDNATKKGGKKKKRNLKKRREKEQKKRKFRIDNNCRIMFITKSNSSNRAFVECDESRIWNKLTPFFSFSNLFINFFFFLSLRVKGTSFFIIFHLNDSPSKGWVHNFKFILFFIFNKGDCEEGGARLDCRLIFVCAQCVYTTQPSLLLSDPIFFLFSSTRLIIKGQEKLEFQIRFKNQRAPTVKKKSYFFIRYHFLSVFFRFFYVWLFAC